MAAGALGQDPATACESQQCAQGGLDLPGICLRSPHLEQLRIKEVLSPKRSEQSSRPILATQTVGSEKYLSWGPLARAPRVTGHQNLRAGVRMEGLQNIEFQTPPRDSDSTGLGEA